MGDILDYEIAEDIKRVAKQLNSEEISRSEYLAHGKFTVYQIYDGGRIWEDLCNQAGVSTKKKEPIPDDVYFQRLLNAVTTNGRLPKTSERKKFGLNFSKRRYPTLRAFLEKAIQEGIIDNKYLSNEFIQANQYAISTENQEKQPNSCNFVERQVPPIPKITRRNKWERTGIEGFPYAPQDELGVVALFAILCYLGKINWQILEMRGGKGIDTTCFDHNNQKEIRVELKHTHSKANWNHKLDEIDYVVCWENRWLDFPKPVIILKDILQPKYSQ